MSYSFEEKLSVEDRIIKGKIKLTEQSPFFSYLALHMRFNENKRVKCIGVDPDGNVFWNKAFMEKLSDKEMVGVILHETLHTTLRHPERMKGKDKNTANIAMDLVVNQMIVSNGFRLPKGGLIPEDNEFTIMGKTITNISEKLWEQIYEELIEENEDDDDGEGSGSGDGEGEGEEDEEGTGTGKGKGYQFDEHMPDVQQENEDSKEIKDKEDSEKNEPEISNNEDLDEKWARILSEAVTRQKMAGHGTLGMERYVEKFLNPKQSWKSILAREIRQETPVDYDWSVPSRRSHEYGIYLPSQRKENLNLAIAIDSSGSVDNDELKTFVSKVWEIVQGVRNINLTVIVCDDKIHSVQEFTNSNLNDIKKIKVLGEGGTNFQPPIDHVAKNKRNTKLLIYLTDGGANKPDISKFSGRVLWVLSKKGTDYNIKGTGAVIKMTE